jgi:hypothetical protein
VIRRLQSGLKRLRWIHLAPVLAFVALSAWAFASPIGAAPDDNFHLTSVWCADGGDSHCRAGSTPTTREVSVPLADMSCYAAMPKKSAACQTAIMAHWDHGTTEVERGNFEGEYPPLYYAVMHLFAGPDLQVSALVMRLINAALFVGLATALALLRPASCRPTLLWGWLVTLVPLGVFLIPSNNPSGWAITGVGTAFLALSGWFESSGPRRWGLAALTLVGVLIAAGSRGDAAVYAAGAVVTATIMAAPGRSSAWRSWWRVVWLPALAVLVCAGFFLTAGQSSVAGSGFGSSASSIPGGSHAGSPTGFALAAYNLLMLPSLWTGVWGTWPLGSLDTGLPDLVPAAAVVAFVVVAFAGIRWLDRRKAIAAGGVVVVLVVLPVWVLTRGGNIVGENLQPRYLLPIIVLLAFILLTVPERGPAAMTRFQSILVLGLLAVAHLVALQVNIRRYITGIGEQGINLDAGTKWWWTGFPVGPTWVWIIGALAFAGLLVVLWPQLRRPGPDGQVAAATGVNAFPMTR